MKRSGDYGYVIYDSNNQLTFMQSKHAEKASTKSGEVWIHSWV